MKFTILLLLMLFSGCHKLQIKIQDVPINVKDPEYSEWQSFIFFGAIPNVKFDATNVCKIGEGVAMIATERTLGAVAMKLTTPAALAILFFAPATFIPFYHPSNLAIYCEKSLIKKI